MSQTRYDPGRAKRSLFAALIAARRTFGGKRPIVTDGDERTLSYDEIVRGSFALGNALRRRTKPREAVGVLLPTGIGSVLSVFALTAYGRVPAILNFTAGKQSIEAALRAAKVTRVVTAHRFIELAKLEALESWLGTVAELIYLDDLRENLSLSDKLSAVIGSFAPWLVARRANPNHPAIILFTSGTEGEPKGVALSHANLLSNTEQVRAHLALYPTDVVFNPLPIFHSFGLTVGVLVPLYLGLRVILHPTPRQPHEIVRRIRDGGATILLATDTFISQYARAGAEGDLSGLRLAVCGAERVRDETRAYVRNKYGIEILEGYGVTEAGPVISANQPGANRAGTVGHLLPGMESRIEPVEGIPDGGRLYVRGPNVMLGYLHPEAPGEIVPLPEGWHDTGDVVSLDEDGFLSIHGRLKRFAKIGGETVSLTVVENCASALWPDHDHAAICIADERKGEQIVLVTTCKEANRSDLVTWAQRHGVTELAVPRRLLHAAEIPVLGTGKTDYTNVKKIVESAGAGA